MSLKQDLDVINEWFTVNAMSQHFQFNLLERDYGITHTINKSIVTFTNAKNNQAPIAKAIDGKSFVLNSSDPFTYVKPSEPPFKAPPVDITASSGINNEGTIAS